MSEKDPKSIDEKKSSEVNAESIASKKNQWVNAWESFNPNLKKKDLIEEAEALSQPSENIFSSDHVPGIEKDEVEHQDQQKKSTKKEFKKKSKVDSWFKAFNPFDPEQIKKDDPMADPALLEPVAIEESKIRKRLTHWFFISFILFAVWATYAPIDAGVSAQGQVVVSGYRKVVQHPTGGVVREILVKDGDVVEEGQDLIKINPLTIQANLGTIESDYVNVLTTEARLKAEELGKDIKWPIILSEMSNQDQVAELKATQLLLLKTRRNEYSQAIQARETQLQSLIKEEKNLAQLAEEGLVPKAQAEQAMRSRLEMVNNINNIHSTYFKQIENDLTDVQKRRESLQLQLKAAKFDEAHTSIKSPATGTIIGLKVVTVGGVIGNGQVLAEVVPRDAKLVIDVKLPENVIDRVKKGALVDLHFTAFNTITTPTVPGRVLQVGSDKVLPDKTKTGEPNFEYYPAIVETTVEGEKMMGDLKVQPGMPVDVVIKTGTRSFLSYILKPISDRVNRAFK
jgi:protease secretion system membrane fusion protein